MDDEQLTEGVGALGEEVGCGNSSSRRQDDSQSEAEAHASTFL